ncbi:MAG: hypothetical protein ACK4TA_14300 [Saprospiraceae bacterium]
MAERSENSFGARLDRARKMLGSISTFPNYNPPRNEETVAGLTDLINQIVTLNQEETSLEQQYNTLVKNREGLFYEDEHCIIKLLTMVRGAVEALYGKESIEFSQVDTLVRQMRDNRPAEREATEKLPAGKVSQSERSYGSITQNFSDLVTIVSQLPNYRSNNPLLQISELRNLVNRANQLAIDIPVLYQQLTNARDRRRAAYKELKDRGARIKAYVKSDYGTNSTEYKSIKGIAL